MSLYQANVTPEGEVGKIGRELPTVFFYKRTLAQVHADLKKDGAIEVERVATEWRIEARVPYSRAFPHEMAIQKRLDLHWRHPDGPPPFQMRYYTQKLKPPVEPNA